MQNVTNSETSEEMKNELTFRVLSDGMLTVIPYLDKSKLLEADAGVLKVFIEAYFPLVRTFDEPFQTAVGSKGSFYTPFPLLRTHLCVSDLGTHIIRFKAGDYEGTK